MKELAENIYVENAYRLLNVGAVRTQAGWVCIDAPPYPEDARDWLEQLKAISDQPVRYLILTDHHRDRILTSDLFKAPVVTHEQSAQVMITYDQSTVIRAAEELSKNDNELVDIASQDYVRPQIAFSESIYLISGEREITLLHRPSATSGTCWVVLNEEQIAFTGDSLAVDRHPYLSSGESKNWLNLLGDIRRGRYEGWTLVPGRDSVLKDPAQMEALAEYLRVARRRINSLCRAERPRSEVASIIPEMLELFPYARTHREEIQRRIKTGLEAIYDELRSQDGNDDGENEDEDS